jgi:hypothetical protein
VVDEVDPIGDDEFLYRRIPASMNWYDEATGVLDESAFDPHRLNDATGLSLARDRYKTVEEASRGRPGKSYFVAVLRVGDLRANGIEVMPRPDTPDGFDPSHVELPQIRSDNRKTTEALNQQRLLAKTLCVRVEGPFNTDP